MRFIRENVIEEQDFSINMSLTQINLTNNTIDNNHFNTMTTTSLIVLSDSNSNNNTNLTNKSLLISSSNKYNFPWEYNWNFIILLALGLIFVIFLINMGLWYWCKRVNHLRRQHSLPLSDNDFIETTKIQEKRLSFSPVNNNNNNNNNNNDNILTKPPPIPPRPTAYTTILGKIEYRSNL
ncbi:unnamed protein product [Rotaria sordida]|uniref:Uncharacterized protein n=1 Tax=Rotaria sordida TaxID=392033 RepID=A0A813VSF9_9BILA|nr:unnamed protein product [Rotaria sordida]CAF0884324.1 unnamed protein product [Rotaria sordida]